MLESGRRGLIEREDALVVRPRWLLLPWLRKDTHSRLIEPLQDLQSRNVPSLEITHESDIIFREDVALIG